MKQFLFIITAAFILLGSASCGGNNPTTQTTTATPETPHAKPESKKVNPSDILTGDELALLTGANKRGGKKVKLAEQVTLATEDSPILSDDGGSQFSINYGGATNVVTMFFRGGDSTSTVSGNVFGTASLQYDKSITSWTSTFTRTYYQSIVIYGSSTPDANGILGTDWVFKYSNVVQ